MKICLFLALILITSTAFSGETLKVNCMYKNQAESIYESHCKGINLHGEGFGKIQLNKSHGVMKITLPSNFKGKIEVTSTLVNKDYSDKTKNITNTFPIGSFWYDSKIAKYCTLVLDITSSTLADVINEFGYPCKDYVGDNT
tara:strand:+ start:631 stop:1056 length:426 start_codon:yes stop_codon:yes gene_type:complete